MTDEYEFDEVYFDLSSIDDISIAVSATPKEGSNLVGVLRTETWRLSKRASVSRIIHTTVRSPTIGDPMVSSSVIGFKETKAYEELCQIALSRLNKLVAEDAQRQLLDCQALESRTSKVITSAQRLVDQVRTTGSSSEDLALLLQLKKALEEFYSGG